MYKHKKNIGKSIKRKSIKRKSIKRKSIKRKSIKRKIIKRKSIKRKSIKRKSIKRKSITFSGGAEPYYGEGIEPPIVTELSTVNEIIKFSEEIKQELIRKIGPGNYNKIGWFRKKIMADIPTGCFVDKTKFIIDQRLPHIIGLISEKLIEKGLHVKKELKSSDINVEIHYANAESKPIGSGLVIHQDNDGGINGLLHTFIVYLDIDCQGGELEIYSDKKDFVKQIDVKTVKNPGTKNIVMFNGGLHHKPNQIKNGKRVIVSYQIRQNNPIGSRGGGHLVHTGEGDSCPNDKYEEDNESNDWSA
jgi:hypothetical protein